MAHGAIEEYVQTAQLDRPSRKGRCDSPLQAHTCAHSMIASSFDLDRHRLLTCAVLRYAGMFDKLSKGDVTDETKVASASDATTGPSSAAGTESAP